MERTEYSGMSAESSMVFISAPQSTSLQGKMQECLANGALLGWLIDRKNKKVYDYLSNRKPASLDDPELVSGDPELP
jgi:hypothetical protein